MAKDNRNRCNIARVTKLQDFTKGVNREKNYHLNKENSPNSRVRAKTVATRVAENFNPGQLGRGSMQIPGLGSLTTIKEGWQGNGDRDSETVSNVVPSRVGSGMPKAGDRRTSASNTNAPRKPNKFMTSLANIEDPALKGGSFFKKLNTKEKPAFNVYGSKIVKSKDASKLSEKMAKDSGNITDKLVNRPTTAGPRKERVPRSAKKFAPDYKNKYRGMSKGEMSEASPSKLQPTGNRDASKSRDAKGKDR